VWLHSCGGKDDNKAFIANSMLNPTVEVLFEIGQHRATKNVVGLF